MSTRRFASAALILIACGHPVKSVPADGDRPTPCSEVIQGCTARRLANVVLRGDAEDGALGPIDGVDATRVIGFDEALAAAGEKDLLGDDANTVQVILGAANAEELHWGAGETHLFYAVKWSGVELPCFGPPGGCDGAPDFGTWASVIDATTGRWISSGG